MSITDCPTYHHANVGHFISTKICISTLIKNTTLEKTRSTIGTGVSSKPLGTYNQCRYTNTRAEIGHASHIIACFSLLCTRLCVRLYTLDSHTIELVNTCMCRHASVLLYGTCGIPIRFCTKHTTIFSKAGLSLDRLVLSVACLQVVFHVQNLL